LLTRDRYWRPDATTESPEERSCFKAALEEPRRPRSKTWMYGVAGAGVIGVVVALLTGGGSDNGTISISVPIH
jgi:hypothetical protein